MEIEYYSLTGRQEISVKELWEVLPSVKASLLAQMVKNLAVMQEIRIPSLGWENPLEKEMAAHYRFLPGDSNGQRSLVGYSLWGPKE